MDRDPFDLVGDTLDGQFRVVAVVGAGDLSVVYKGHHLGLDTPVAIKCLDLPATLGGALVRPLVERFREACRLHHELAGGNRSIVQSLASGSTLAAATGMIVPYLVREWLEGESLGADLERRRAEGRKGRTVDEVVALLEPVVDAVAYAHAQGALHLSLNPRNLFLDERGDGRRSERSLKVLDFGISRMMNELARDIPPESRPPGLRTLFPAYAAPEQLDRSIGEPGPSTDVYALALLMMELLSDRVVMAEADTAALAARVLDEQRRPTPHAHGLTLPRNLDLVLIRAVARAPGRRQKNATSLWKDVKTSLRGSTSGATSAATRSSSPPAPALELAWPEDEPSLPPPSVSGAVPSRRLVVPPVSSMVTVPMGFEVRPTPGPTYVPLPAVAAVEHPPELSTVQAVTTPPPPQPAAPALPPVIVDVDSPPPPVAASPLVASAELSPPTFSTLEEAPRRRSSPVLVSLLTAVIGASLGVALVVFYKRQTAPPVLVAAPPVLVAAPPPSSSTRVPALPPGPSSTPSLPSASASTPEPDVDHGPPEVVVPAAHFPAGAAKLSLDAASHDLARCRLGKVWGTATASVTFSNDGAVSQIAVGIPFTGTTTGQCVSEALKTANVPPYAGKPGVVAYRFFVPMK